MTLTLADMTPTRWMLNKSLEKHLCTLCQKRVFCEWNIENAITKEQKLKAVGCALKGAVIRDIFDEVGAYLDYKEDE